MTGTTRSSRRRGRVGMLLTTGAVGALLLAGATACASSSKSVSVSSGGSYSGSAAPTSASPSPSASASASPSKAASASPSTTSPTLAGGGGGGVANTPNEQLTTAPSNTKYAPFESAAHSADGRTLYLAIESQGGACGRYDVVVQESSGSVSVGLIHLPAGTQMCPMYVTRMLVPAKLSAPLDGRRVIDLANGQTVASPQIG